MLLQTLNDFAVIVKIVHDSIHGSIGLSFFAMCIIDTLVFQRLSHLKQLGPCRYIYQNAVHTRYEHSLGTYHLAGELISTIVNLDNQSEIDMYLREIPELKNYYERVELTTSSNLLTPYVRELIKIAALCHDIGHGPFSHLFDDVFLQRVDTSNNPNKSHEERSNLLIDMVIRNHEILGTYVMPSDIEFIKSIINPKYHHTGWVYQIVSNNLNGLDVDKYDYLQRDIKTIDFAAKIDTTILTKYIRIIDNNIIYPIQAYEDIENLFRTRHNMYKKVYLHPLVMAVEHLITEIMIEMNKIMNLAGSIDNMETFITLNDNTIIECENVIEKLNITFSVEQLESYGKIKILSKKLNTRDFLTVLHSTTTKNKVNIDAIIDSIGLGKTVICSYHKIGFLSGNKPNPFEYIYFFDPTRPHNVVGNVLGLKRDLPVLSSTNTHQEFVTNFYYDGIKDVDRIDEIGIKIKNGLMLIE